MGSFWEGMVESVFERFRMDPMRHEFILKKYMVN